MSTKKIFKRTLAILMTVCLLLGCGIISVLAADSNSTTVYFYNGDGWSDVYAYEWSTQLESNVLGSWPGTQATSVGNGWYSVDVPLVANGNDACFNIIFNNNGGDNNKQYEATIIDTENVYMKNENDATYASKEAALGTEVPSTPVTPSDDETIVYFYNGDGWSDVYAYEWSTQLESNVLGEWPGTQATAVGGGWYCVNVPLVANGNDACFNIIFNNNGGDDVKQYEATIIDNVNIYMINKSDVTYTSKEEALGGESTNPTDSETPTTPITPPADDETAVYFYNGDGWTDVYAYEWSTQLESNVLGEWPGTQATAVGGGWYCVNVPLVANGNDACFNIIFNNNGGDDVQQYEGTIIDTVNVYMKNESNATYASKEEALGQAPTTPVPGEDETVIYFYNGDNWDEVYAYEWSEELESDVLGSWPGTQATSIGDGWYTIIVPLVADGEEKGFNIIFNNNGGESNQQYDNYIIDTVNVYTKNESNKTYASKEEALGGESADAYDIGDVDLSGVINIKDATLIQKHLASIVTLTEQQAALADFNNDKTINIKDATAIQKFIAGL